MAIDELIGRIRTAATDLAERQPAIEAGEPWPLAEQFGGEPEALWGPRETLGHVAEMLPYWTGELERVLAGQPDRAVPFGRTASDPLRLGVIERDRTLPIRELVSRITFGADRLATRLDELAPGAATRLGVHPTLGEMTVAGLLERFVAGHLEEHVAQLDTTLAPARR